MKQKIGKVIKSKSFHQLIKYGIVGMIGLVIDMGLFYLLVDYWSVHYPFSTAIYSLIGGKMAVNMLDILISSIIGQTLAVINNFILNSYFTFKVTDNKIKRFLSFAGIAAIGMIISSVLLTLFIDIMGLHKMLSKAIAIIFVAMMQFAINKFFTFKEKKDE